MSYTGPKFITDIPRMVFDAVSKRWGNGAEGEVTLPHEKRGGSPDIYLARPLTKVVTDNFYIGNTPDVWLVLANYDNQTKRGSRVELITGTPKTVEDVVHKSSFARVHAYQELQASRLSSREVNQGCSMQLCFMDHLSLAASNNSIADIALYMMACGRRLARPFPHFVKAEKIIDAA